MRLGALLSVVAALALAWPASASAAPPEPVPGTPNCHGLSIAAAAKGNGLGNLAREQGIEVIPLHDLLFAHCIQ
jgi:hypothetical protein